MAAVPDVRFAAAGEIAHTAIHFADPVIHPLVDLRNAVSMAFAIPVAVYDSANVDQYLKVRRAIGDETYLTFSGETENPEPGEVIFADASGRAHARRWTNRQSGLSAIRPGRTVTGTSQRANGESPGTGSVASQGLPGTTSVGRSSLLARRAI